MKKLKLKLSFLAAIVSIGLLSCGSDDEPSPNPDPAYPPEIGHSGDGLLSGHLSRIVEEQGIPALSATFFQDTEILESASVGLRSEGSPHSVTATDQWHVGSITKSMTATLVAILVEEEVLEWGTTISDVFADAANEPYGDITIVELLSHTAGVTQNEDLGIDHLDGAPVSDKRLEWAVAALESGLSARGTHRYTNNNYVIIGVLLEALTGTPWESLLTMKLLEPLGMSQTAFGAPGTAGGTDQPWGHTGSPGDWSPRDPGDVFSDNPQAIGPAGTVHTTVNDLAKYVAVHLGHSQLLSEASLIKLHSEVGNSGYALGWNVSPFGVFHAGSNGRWFAQLVISRNMGIATFSVTNSYHASDGGNSVTAVQEALGLLGQRFENL